MIEKQQILRLLQKYIDNDIITTETQYSDTLDFKDVHIMSLVNLIEAAFKEGCNSRCDKGTQG